jgi:hypothetical protein
MRPGVCTSRPGARPQPVHRHGSKAGRELLGIPLVRRRDRRTALHDFVWSGQQLVGTADLPTSSSAHPFVSEDRDRRPARMHVETDPTDSVRHRRSTRRLVLRAEGATLNAKTCPAACAGHTDPFDTARAGAPQRVMRSRNPLRRVIGLRSSRRSGAGVDGEGMRSVGSVSGTGAANCVGGHGAVGTVCGS